MRSNAGLFARLDRAHDMLLRAAMPTIAAKERGPLTAAVREHLLAGGVRVVFAGGAR